ncbi:interleukin-5 receptor subunit alpha [Microcaecilia unicolor]|uniref:Interleukin-5 receptor subunit alpha n=1 Tax=Microcaecilia unicolor TaxID=1415580 RepID=A0A6P7YFQ0_9AMPH|nr:interleukin-5 receptor subunit alpha [Microcaecilia unicolor]
MAPAQAQMGTIFLLFIGISKAINDVQMLKPIDLSIEVLILGEVLLSWKPNVNPELESYVVKYNVLIKTPMKEEQYTTQNNSTKRMVALHKGLCAQVCAVYYEREKETARSQWAKAKLQAPPGANGTSITNLSCVIYTEASNNTAMDCSWLPGEEAPEDTQYFLFYRYNIHLEECQNYSRSHDGKRHSSCQFAKTDIQITEDTIVVIYVNGSSKHSTIKPFDQLFNPSTIERINPPMNITVALKQESLCAEWMKPVSVWPSPCFTYEINVSDWVTGSTKQLTVKDNSICLLTNSQSRYSVQVRAAGSDLCGNSKQWSAWSKPVFSDKPQKASVLLLLFLVYGALAGIMLLSAVLCTRFQLHRRLFPQVPAPRNPFKDLLSYNEAPTEGALEVISDIDDPEPNE